jgi:hypothetical protein
MSLKRNKSKQKGGVLEDITDDTFNTYKQMYDDLIKYDELADLENIQKTENQLLAAYLIKHKDGYEGIDIERPEGGLLIVKKYIASLNQKLLELFKTDRQLIFNAQRSSIHDEVKSIKKITYKVNNFTKYYTINDLVSISLSNGLYTVTKSKFNISNINTAVIELSNKYTKVFYSNDREFDIFLLRLSKMFNGFRCMDVPTNRTKKILIIHYLNLRLISILNKYYILYIAVPILFFNIYINSGNCFNTPIATSIFGVKDKKVDNYEKKIILSHNIVEIYNLYTKMLVSSNEVDIYIKSLTELDEPDILKTLTKYPIFKGIINASLLFSATIGFTNPVLTPIFAISTSIAEAIVTDKDEHNFLELKETENIINNFYVVNNIPADLKEKISKDGLDKNKYEYDPDKCDTDKHIKKVSELIDSHTKITFYNYDVIKFYCYIFKTIINWQCNTKEIQDDVIPPQAQGQEPPNAPIEMPSSTSNNQQPLAAQNSVITTQNIIQDETLKENTAININQDLKNYFVNFKQNGAIKDDVVLQENINKLRGFIKDKYNLLSLCDGKIASFEPQLKGIITAITNNDYPTIKNALCGKTTGGKTKRSRKGKTQNKRSRKGKTKKRR